MLYILAISITEQARGNKRILRGILHPHHRTAIHGCYLENNMQFTGGGTANHHGYVKPHLLHLAHHVDHLLKTRSDKSAETDDIHFLLDSLAHYLFGWHHHSHVDYLVVVAGHHHAHDILSDVVDIALDS